ncbi:MAG: hypothetical protein COA77_02555 [Thaumarchaeota archaeon]|nr:MAG: hypothetical protein COA77_02555 [Nitrososphaerota archaeon]
MPKMYKLVTDYDPGIAVETKEWDLPSDDKRILKCLILDIVGQRNGVADPTRQVVASQLDEIKVGVAANPEVSRILGEDLYNNNVLLGNRPIFDGGGADNSRVSLGMVLPLDPFMMSPQIDYHQPYGMPGGIASQLSVKFDADDAAFDGKKLTVGVISSLISDLGGFSKLQGYMSYTRHSDTMAVGTEKSYAIPQPGKLLGVQFFETTSFADIIADGEYRSTQSIQEASITRGENVTHGALPTTTFGIMNGADVTELTDQGYSLWNLGIHNKVGSLGIPDKGRIPSNLKVKVLGGVADAVRIVPITLNDKLTV